MNVNIEKIEIVSFGKLKNTSVSAKSGINILSAPNESGKSTLAAFIKFVFYGYIGGRKEALIENEKKLYTPWDGEVSEGSVTIIADGNKYTVHRRCLASGKETVEVLNYHTGKPDFVGQIPGEVFFGVSEDVFARTLFFRQLTTPQAKDEILADRLRNIAISADEQVGTKKAVSRLNDSKNELKGRLGNGIIPKSEKERDALEEAITNSLDLKREITRLNLEIEKRNATINEASKKLDELNLERRNIEKYEALLKLDNINRLALEERNAREEYDEISAGLKKRDNDGSYRELFAKNTEYVAECRDCEKISQSLEIAETELEAIEGELKIDKSKAKIAQKVFSSSKKTSNILFIIAGILLVIGIITALASSETTGIGIVVCVFGAIAGAIGAVMLAKPNALAKEMGLSGASELKEALDKFPISEKQLHETERRVASFTASYEESRTRCSILKRELDRGIGAYVDINDNNYSASLQHILELSSVSGEKLAVWRSKKEEFDNIAKGIDLAALEEEAKDAKEPTRDKNKVDRELNFYNSQFNQLSELNRRDELNIATMEAKCGDVASMVGKRDSLDSRIFDLNIKYKAYETAIKYIEEAADYMKSMVAPRIGERADEYFTAATGGKYSSFEVDTKLSMSFGEDMRRSCDFLSAGTRDSAYLSLRLALADMLFGGCGVPILLDDAFVRIDDQRLKMISGALKEASKKHQIFILTHSDREETAFNAVGMEFNKIALKQE